MITNHEIDKNHNKANITQEEMGKKYSKTFQ